LYIQFHDAAIGVFSTTSSTTSVEVSTTSFATSVVVSATEVAASATVSFAALATPATPVATAPSVFELADS
jgi:hypothetical protein